MSEPFGRMPAEWEPHAATWMAFPPAVYEGGSLRDARAAWLAVVAAVATFEPVLLLVDPKDLDVARASLPRGTTVVEAPLDDAWARDIGPTFVRRADGTLGAIDWAFNGWGGQSWAKWEHDDQVASLIARHANARVHRSHLVNEGGGIETDGAGTFVVTETVQLDPGRNPGWDRAAVERELHATVAADRVVWLSRGLEGDYGAFGTRGHVDLLVKFVAPGVAVFHDQRDPEHPDHRTSAAIRAALEAASITAVGLAAPSTRVVDGRVCDYSYVNCYLCDGGVVLGTYDDDADHAARATLSTLLPGRRIVPVDARGLFALGGGVHCITQQQPL